MLDSAREREKINETKKTAIRMNYRLIYRL